MRRLLIPVVAALLVAAAVVGCSSEPKGPVGLAEAFLAAFAAGELDRAAEMTSRPEKAGEAMASVWQNLQAEELIAQAGAARVTGDTATVDYSYEWRLPKERVWSYSGQLQMGRTEGRWLVRWTSSNIHPQIGRAACRERGAHAGGADSVERR